FCQTPLGPGDYLAIAQACRVLFITDIPILTASDDSAAKRFITMIDTLYEAQVNVIISAAAPPDKLYQGKKLAFEFQRTASRLYEMQSTDWGAERAQP
ncbi:MAG: cell division protein ZapE, partial [Proteobacteria bacterium]|nr:cell division protein ZapE [Pseudomonadota bacterium]